MPIAVFCRKCDQRYQVKDEFAGKKIRCPDCQNVIEVGTCTNDGIEVLDEDEEEEYGDQPRALPERRRRRSREDRLAKRSRSRSGRGLEIPQWSVAVGIGVVAMLLMAVLCLFSPLAMQIMVLALGTVAALTAVGGFGLNLVGMIGGWFKALILSMEEDRGLLFLFVPFYPIYFIITRIDQLHPFRMIFFVGLMCDLAGLLLFVSSIGLTGAGFAIHGQRYAAAEIGFRKRPTPTAWTSTNPSNPWAQQQQPPLSAPVQPQQPMANFPQPAQPVHQPAPEFPQPNFAPPNFPAPQARPNFPQNDTRKQSYLNRTQAEIRTIPAPRGHEFAAGDTVYLEWGANWYECEVLEVNSAGHPKVHWIGWSSSWDEYFTPDKIRIPRKKKSQD